MALFEDNIEQAKNPDWEEFDKKYKRVHDWRTYITPEVRKQWDFIDLEARCIVIHIAQEVADSEHWE